MHHTQLILSVDRIKRNAANIEEDYPGRRAQYIREKAIQLAVSVADQVIMEASTGSEEDTDFLTAHVALKFSEKVAMGASRLLSRKELITRFKEKP